MDGAPFLVVTLTTQQRQCLPHYNFDYTPYSEHTAGQTTEERQGSIERYVWLHAFALEHTVCHNIKNLESVAQVMIILRQIRVSYGFSTRVSLFLKIIVLQVFSLK
ncbi:MAG: hypothetical protein LBD04_02230, partial [Synergistaceae bacterium]|nr:hypothetical protein [Synergistaceae bacterium]